MKVIDLFKKTALFYITENADWSIMWDAKYTTSKLNEMSLMKSKVALSVK
jgi:hypothetical protein